MKPIWFYDCPLPFAFLSSHPPLRLSFHVGRATDWKVVSSFVVSLKHLHPMYSSHFLLFTLISGVNQAQTSLIIRYNLIRFLHLSLCVKLNYCDTAQTTLPHGHIHTHRKSDLCRSTEYFSFTLTFLYVYGCLWSVYLCVCVHKEEKPVVGTSPLT